MGKSKAFEDFITQLESKSYRRDSYNSHLFEDIYETERDEVEEIIYATFMKNKDVFLIVFMPQLKNYDGVAALKQKLPECRIPSWACVEMAMTLWKATGDEKYIDLVMENYKQDYNNSIRDMIVGELSGNAKNDKIYNILVSVYINAENKVERSSALRGILYNKGLMKNPSDSQEVMDKLDLIRKFRLDSSKERKSAIEKLEAGKIR